MAKQAPKKLVIAVSSRALFDLNQSHDIFQEQGVEAYAQYQHDNKMEILNPGVGFSLIKKLLNLHSESNPIDVILLSRNSAQTCVRVFNSIKHHKLNITRAAFTSGAEVGNYLSSFEADLFLSQDHIEVKKSLEQGFAAASIVGQLDKAKTTDQLRIAFDGDAVLFSDESEKIYQKEGLEAFEKNELQSEHIPLKPGPFKAFLESLQHIQSAFGAENNPIRTALVTARSTTTQARIINTMAGWGIRIDESFFLGGLDKGKILQAFDADIFFDDQKKHCDSAKQYVPTGHVPNGITNKETSE